MSFFSRLFRSFSSTNPSTAHILPPSKPPANMANLHHATFAAGCFWGVEHIFRKNFGSRLSAARVGYIGDDRVDNPSYRKVCSGGTRHAEAVRLEWTEESGLQFKELVEFFFRMHDPTTKDQQGGDRGAQYRSAVFYEDDEQKSVAEEIKEQVQKQWWKRPVVTEVVKAGKWWDAEDYHQLYLDKNPGGYECPSHYVRTFPPLST